MQMLFDAITISRKARSPVIFAIFVLNLTLNQLGVKKRIRRFPKTRVDIHGVTFFVASWDSLLAIRPGNEPQVHTEIAQIASEPGNGVFVNVGAHIGRYCLEFGDKFAKTIAYEPTHTTFELLKEGWKLHPNREKIDLRCVGVSNEPGQATFLISAHESKNSIVQNESTVVHNTQEIELVTLDLDLSDEDKRNFRLLLIDVEGAEDLVLNGALKSLAVGSPTILIELLDQAAHNKCDPILTQLGYNGTQLDHSNWKYTRLPIIA